MVKEISLARKNKLHDDDDRGPRLGALLRLCHQAFHSRIGRRLAESGDAPVIGAVTQPLWDHPDGMRLTDLASYAGMTKQSMGELVERMEAVGYVERVPDPNDGRARLVRFSEKGRRIAKKTRALVHETEARWAARVGEKELERLRKTLQAILAGEADEQ